MGGIIRVIKGDTRSLDYSSYDAHRVLILGVGDHHQNPHTATKGLKPQETGRTHCHPSRTKPLREIQSLWVLSGKKGLGFRVKGSRVCGVQ